jgi:queuine/archaeosine tRNA-ribosyltransferase
MMKATWNKPHPMAKWNSPGGDIDVDGDTDAVVANSAAGNVVRLANTKVHSSSRFEPSQVLNVEVQAGIDTFDCVVPTRNGRNGTVYTEDGKFSIEKAQFATDLSPIDPSCSCRVCTTYTRSYVHHLFRSKEMLGMVLASMHNMHFLADLTARIRASIVDGTFMQFRDSFLGRYKAKKGASA